jgi:DNA-binding NarL/FixJ family response regulator
LHRQSFLAVVQSVLKQNDMYNLLKGKLLTERETDVLHLILQGRSNKEIADTLHRSVRTIEDHRCHIMRKLGVDNVVDLVKRATAMGLVESSGTE